MEKQAIQYLDEHREDLLKYIRRKGLSIHDAEDLLTEATIDLLKYYKEDRVKSLHLAIGRQLDQYYRGRGTVSHQMPPEDFVQYKEGDWLDDLSTSTKESAVDPLDVLMLEEISSKYVDMIHNFTDNNSHQHFLELVYVEGVPSTVAQDIVGLTSQNASMVNARFLKKAGG